MGEISDSRFYMWRAVFAMAHVDGKVTEEEVAFAEKYLANAPFSDAQKETLREDMRVPKPVADMLAVVSEASDQADFFQFSQMLAWADGDYSVQEQALAERMNAAQMDRFDENDMKRQIRDARKAAILRRALEDQAFESQARDVSGFANVIRHIAPWMETTDFEAPDAEMFKLWRAVFGLVHVDGEVSSEERDYIEGMMDVFHFSDAQRVQVAEDLKIPADVVQAFQAIGSTRHRKQFFVMARTIVWCDGIFHDDERDSIEAIKESLGESVSEYDSEIRWIDRKPDVADGGEGDDQERMMKGVVKQMVEFYSHST